VAIHEGPYAKAGVWVAVIGLVLTYGIAAATQGWWPFPINRSKAAVPAHICPNQQIYNPDDDPRRLRPPKNLSVAWDRSPTIRGRVSATVHWTNVDAATSMGLLEVVGRYGVTNPNDEPTRTDGRPLPTEGICGDWYRRYHRADDGERGVFFDGLWPNDRYCFAVNSSDPGGGLQSPYPSIETPAVCEDAPWYSAWGEAAQP
jgi:hypothetical protein